ncbi:hypothetical protein NE237_009105 [Protea cynaroides]|uniref:Uncharacterized protein n=1 Tax=Protea cynaroides TaxID=273540 RepID=A0A9Q0QZZ3_9MAGN|nr:hypothetical protein NE237_009105 [Protea cynaroides]
MTIQELQGSHKDKIIAEYWASPDMTAPTTEWAVYATRLIKAQQAGAKASTVLSLLAKSTPNIPSEAHTEAHEVGLPPLRRDIPSSVEKVPHSSTELIIPPFPSMNIEGMTSQPVSGTSPPNNEGLPPTPPGEDTSSNRDRAQNGRLCTPE